MSKRYILWRLVNCNQFRLLFPSLRQPKQWCSFALMHALMVDARAWLWCMYVYIGVVVVGFVQTKPVLISRHGTLPSIASRPLTWTAVMRLAEDRELCRLRWSSVALRLPVAIVYGRSMCMMWSMNQYTLLLSLSLSAVTDDCYHTSCLPRYVHGGLSSLRGSPLANVGF